MQIKAPCKNKGILKLTRIAHSLMYNVPQGLLSLRFSGVCPDACAKGQPTAH